MCTRLFVLAVLFLAGGGTFPLRVIRPRNGLPPRGKGFVCIRGMVRLPAGTAAAPGGAYLLDRDGRRLAADFHVHRGVGGTYLGFTASAPARKIAGEEGLSLRIGAGSAGAPKGPQCRCTRVNGRVCVDTGPLQARFDPAAPGLVETLRVEGAVLFGGERSWYVEVRDGGGTFRSAPPRTVLLLEGKASARVVVTGGTVSDRGGAGPSYRLELRFYAGSPRVEGRVTLEAPAASRPEAAVYLRFHPLLEQRRIRLLFRGERPRPRLCSGMDREAVLTCGEGGVEVRRGRKVTPLEGACSAGVRASDGRRGCWFWFPSFAALHPWSFRCGPDAFSLCLFTDAFFWEEGIPLRRGFVLEPFRGRGGGDPPGESPFFALARARALRSPAFVDPGEGDPRDPLEGRYLETTAALAARLDEEWRAWDGYRDRGDYRTAAGEFANEEYDPAYGLLKRFLLSCEPGDLERARCMLEHHLLFDRTGPADAPLPRGLPFGHGEDHRSGWIEEGHMWVDGTLLAWRLFGEERYRLAALDVGRYLAGRAGRGGPREKERCAAWSLAALAALVEAGFPEFADPMNRCARRIREHQDRCGWFFYDRRRVGERSLERVNTWVTAGITLEALYRHHRVAGDPRSAAALLHCADRLVRDGWRRREGGWSSILYYDAGTGTGEGGGPVSRKGRVRGEDLLFLALGLARAAELSGDRALALRARETAQRGLEELRARPPAYPGRALAVTARCMPGLLRSCRAAGGAGGGPRPAGRKGSRGAAPVTGPRR